MHPAEFVQGIEKPGTQKTFRRPPVLIYPTLLFPMKFLQSLPLLLVTSLSGVTSSTAQEKTAGKPASQPAAIPTQSSTRVTEERTTTAVFPDPNLDKLEGKVVRIDGEKKQLLLRTKNGKEPIPYNVNLATKFVDLDGMPVDPALIIAEVPVEVRYVENGPDLMASTVVVQRYQAPVPGGGVTLTTRETLKAGGKVIGETLKTTTTTATRSGTLGTMENGVFTVVGEAGSAPQRYQYSETTQWTNASGEPLPAATIKPGYVVKVSYSQRGDGVFAERIVVLPPGGDSSAGRVPASGSSSGIAPAPVPNALPTPVPGAAPAPVPGALPTPVPRNAGGN